MSKNEKSKKLSHKNYEYLYYMCRDLKSHIFDILFTRCSKKRPPTLVAKVLKHILIINLEHNR